MAEWAADPTLSVVVPIYNVAQYLDECLQSVADQAVVDFEVVMVDDGSTDRSGEIAERWAARDSRYRLIRQTNHGLGHARNTGAADVRGKYLAFLDSDDRVGVDSYQRMISSLEETGSDFATGNVHRFDSSGRSWQASRYRNLAKMDLPATHVSKERELLRDHLAHNKVWRTSFWRDNDLNYPVGVLYEDIPTTIPAHVMAKSVDVVSVVAIYWRLRDQGDQSITQNRHRDQRHLHDRVAGMLTASRYIGEHSSKDVKDDYDVLVLSRDLRMHVELYPEVSEAYRDEVFSAIGQYLDQVSPEARQRTPADMRIAYALLELRAREDFAEYVYLRRAGRVGTLPIEVHGDRAVLDLQLPAGTALSDSDRDVTSELTVSSRVSGIEVTDGELVIKGWAWIPRLTIDDPNNHEIKVWMEGAGRTVSAHVTYRHDDRAAVDAGARAAETGRVAFTARFPLRELQGRWLKRPSHRTVMVSVRNVTIRCEGTLTGPLVGKPERPVLVPLRGRHWLRVCWKEEGLTVRVRKETAVLAGVSGSGDALTLSVRAAAPLGSDAQLRLRSLNSTHARSYVITPDAPDSTLGHCRLPVAELPGRESVDVGALESPAREWEVFVRAAKGDAWQALLDAGGYDGSSVVAGDVEAAVHRTRAATVRVMYRAVTPELTRVEWHDGATLRLWMEYAGVAPFEAVTLNARQHDECLPFAVTKDAGQYVASLPVGRIRLAGATKPLRAGTWDVRAQTATGTVDVTIGDRARGALPAETADEGRHYALVDRRRSILSVVVETDLRSTERGTVNQTWLRTSVYPTLKGTVEDAVLYEAYYGKEFSDSPREICAELCRRGLDLEHKVVVRDSQFEVPDGMTAVRHGSKEYYEALAQSKYIVANTHLSPYFSKATDQVVLQTWHGVGVKKIGLDMDGVNFTNKTYIENIRRGEADNWDYLVSPNPFTSPILTRAFAFRGTLLETGVPRNDLFHRPDRDERAARVKERLGIAHGRKVVLYAPTWRDNAFHGRGRYRLDLRFDVHAAARKLGEEYAIVFRKHSNVVDRLPRGSGAVIDASDYPEVQDLLLVTDILISDYSTLMCDFANTGRPMLFYTYDLANFRDVLRGFYFDFENEVPGPLITDEMDVLSAILDADKIRHAYDAKYRRFAERFCPWDDGGASRRVVDAVFEA